MTRKNKNCLTCAFCTRNKNTFRSVFTKPELSRWIRSQETLSNLERDALKSGDDSFIGKEIRDAKLWDEQLEQEREDARRQFEGTPLANLAYAKSIFSAFPNKANDEAATYGISERPTAPDEDYLSCFHEQWDEDKRADTRIDRLGFLENMSCSFYYPFLKKRGESLEACEKNRRDDQERSRFSVTTILIVAGVIVTIVLGVVSLVAQEKTAATQPQIVTPATRKQNMLVIPPAPPKPNTLGAAPSMRTNPMVEGASLGTRMSLASSVIVRPIEMGYYGQMIRILLRIVN